MGTNGLKDHPEAAATSDTKVVRKRRKRAAAAPSVPEKEGAMAFEQETTNIEPEGAPVPAVQEISHDEQPALQSSEEIGKNCEIVVRKAVGGFLRASGA